MLEALGRLWATALPRAAREKARKEFDLTPPTREAPSQIVANHNGRIVLESTPFGSTFRVRF
jgi:hypothetical protein